MPLPPPDRRPPARPRGFTLVELMIVVFIVGLLVAITVTVIPKVYRAVHGAQTSAQMAAMATSMQAYYNDFRAYPGPLPNSQVGANYYAYSTSPAKDGVYLIDPTATEFKLEQATGPLGSETYGTFSQPTFVTGAENLVLGLLGGLELHLDSTGAVKDFAYSYSAIYPDGVTAAPLGPMSLNPAAPKRLGAYIQVKAGDLSNSRTIAAMVSTPTQYTDDGGRTATDSTIPEFLDKFSNPMPILYLRANVGGRAIAAIGGKDDSGAALQDSNKVPVIAQYDLAQVLGYTQNPATGAAIGTRTGDPTRDHHGLQGLGTMTDPVLGTSSSMTGWYNAGKNGLAYLKDPNNPGTTNAPDYTTSPPGVGNARQKDAFLLISAGPDGLYGTPDDIVYPGGSVSGQQ